MPLVTFRWGVFWHGKYYELHHRKPQNHPLQELARNPFIGSSNLAHDWSLGWFWDQYTSRKLRPVRSTNKRLVVFCDQITTTGPLWGHKRVCRMMWRGSESFSSRIIDSWFYGACLWAKISNLWPFFHLLQYTVADVSICHLPCPTSSCIRVVPN
jgi:hypothetical protein